MSIVNKSFVKEFINNNYLEEVNLDGTISTIQKKVPYRWTHGATEHHLGDGMLIYSIIQLMRYKTLVCLGSGGGFIPRIMTQARLDLHDQGIFTGDKSHNHGDIGTTYLVDAANGVGGEVNYLDESSFFRRTFGPRFIKDTTENAYYNFFVKQDIEIDFLHIDAGHSYDDVKRDFDLYSQLVKPNGIISIHDTDSKYQKELIITEDEKEYYQLFDGPPKFIEELGDEWQRFDFFNTGEHRSKPASTGLTLVRKNG